MLRASAIAIAAALLVPGTALAGTVAKSGGTITYTPSAGAAVDQVSVLQDASSNPSNIVILGATATSGCSTYSDSLRTGASCPAPGVTAINVTLGDGNDSARGREPPAGVNCGAAPLPACPPTLFPVSIPLTIDAGNGDDTIVDGAAADNLSAGDGFDTLTSVSGADVQHGGNGDDVLSGGSGAEQLFGEAGRDVLSGGAGNDDIQGGAGIDEASYAGTPQAVKVSLDDVANDGRIDIAEADNVHSDVEALRGGDGSDQLNGNAGDNTLRGGPGADSLAGGAGYDAYYGEEDGATITARDGNAERVDCGTGTADLAQTDTFDLTSGCETVQSSSDLQSDLDQDGSSAPADCADHDPSRHPGATDVPGDGIDQDCSGADTPAAAPDRDGDGAKVPADCDDSNAAVKPGAAEIYGNEVDENCDGRAEPLQTITAFVQSRFTVARRTRVDRLRVRNATAGTTVKAFCRGGKAKGCERAEFTQVLTQDTARVDIRRALGLRKLAGGAKIEIQLLRADSLDKITTFAIKRNRPPVMRTRSAAH